MHVSTAIRYCLDGLVTEDGSGRRRGILGSSVAIACEYDGFRLLSIAEATDVALGRIAHVRLAASHHPVHSQNPDDLPPWP